MSPKQPLDKFCCCFTLRTGGIVLGCLYMIFGVAGVIAINLDERSDLTSILFFMFFITTQTAVITIIMFAIYLFGIFSKIPWLMLPAMVWHMLGVSLQTLIWGFLMLGFISKMGDEVSFIIVLMVGLLWLALMAFQWYLIIVSYSLFNKMKNLNTVTQYDGQVHHTAEEMANLNQVSVEAGAISPGESKR